MNPRVSNVLGRTDAQLRRRCCGLPGARNGHPEETAASASETCGGDKHPVRRRENRGGQRSARSLPVPRSQLKQCQQPAAGSQRACCMNEVFPRPRSAQSFDTWPSARRAEMFMVNRRRK